MGAIIAAKDKWIQSEATDYTIRTRELITREVIPVLQQQNAPTKSAGPARYKLVTRLEFSILLSQDPAKSALRVLYRLPPDYAIVKAKRGSGRDLDATLLPLTTLSSRETRRLYFTSKKRTTMWLWFFPGLAASELGEATNGAHSCKCC